MASYMFGAGRLYIKEAAGAMLQAHRVATLQGVTLSFKADKKDLFGSNRYPVASAQGRQTIEGKADFATFDGRLLAAVLGGTVTTGRSIFYDEALTITAQAVQATQTTGFEDFGVDDASGNPMTRVSAVTALGQYTVSGTGLYGFYSSESGTVRIYYRYTVATGYNAVGANAALAAQTHYVGIFQDEWDNAGTTERFGCELYAIAIPSLDLTFKNDDFAMENLTFSASANSAGNVYKFHYE